MYYIFIMNYRCVIRCKEIKGFIYLCDYILMFIYEWRLVLMMLMLIYL